MITKMKLFGSDAKALYDLDQEFAARTYAVPSPLATADSLRLGRCPGLQRASAWYMGRGMRTGDACHRVR